MGLKVKLELKNKKFGKLLILRERGQDIRKNYLWECKCDCGKIIVRTGAQIMKFKNSNQACSSGCSQTLPPEQAALNILFNHKYKYGAKLRNLEFNLTREQFIPLIKANCFYCGRRPSNKIRDLKYNGIDRKNNSLGYSISNCVSCCYVCNKMKLDMNYDDFLNQVKRIVNFLGLFD